MNRRLWLGIVMLLAGLTVSGQTAWDEMPRRALKVDVPSLFIQTPKVAFEQGLSKRSWVGLTVGGSWQWKNRPLGVHMANALAVGIDYKCFLFYWRFTGLMPYVGLRLVYVHGWGRYDFFSGNEGWDIHTSPATVRADRVSPMFMWGFRQVYGSVFSDFCLGAQLRSTESQRTSAMQNYTDNMFAWMLAISISLGVLF